MSFSEIKEQVRQLTISQLDELAGCVRLARKHADAGWLERVAAINARMDAGAGISDDQVRELHARLESEGK